MKALELFNLNHELAAMKEEEQSTYRARAKYAFEQKGVGYDFNGHDDPKSSLTDGRKILIAERSAFMRVMLTAALEKFGFHVLGSAKDGKEAVDKYRALKPDIVLVDHGLELIDGIDVIRTITAEEPAAVVLMVFEKTADVQDTFIEAVRAGAKDCMQKPLSVTELVTRITVASQRAHAIVS